MPAQGSMAGGRIGIRTLTCGLLLIGAVCGLMVLDTQVQVFSLDAATGPDARTVPMIAFALLVAALILRIALSFRQQDEAIGTPHELLGFLAICGATALGLFLMPQLGFVACSAFAGAVTALAFGERQIIFWALLPLAVAAFIGFVARWALNIPLP